MRECPSCKAPVEADAIRCDACDTLLAAPESANTQIDIAAPAATPAPPQVTAPPEIPTTTADAATVCPQCGKAFPAGCKFCDLDGATLVEPAGMTPACTVCGADYTEGAKFCQKDGAPVLPRALHGKISPAAAANPEPALLPKERLDRLIAEGYEFKLGGYFKQGWEIFLKYPLGFIGFGAIIIAVLHTVMGIVFLYPLMAGFSAVALKMSRNERYDFGDFFRGFRHFAPLFIAGLLALLYMFLGLFTCGILTVYLAVGYSLFVPLILFYGLRAGEALTYSRKIIHRHWLEFFFICLLLWGLLFIAGLTWVGLFFALPVAACVMAAAEQDVLGLADYPRG